MILPSSRVMVSPMSCFRSLRRATARVRISYRSNALSARMALAPRAALLMAISTSSTVPAGTVSKASPVYGLRTSICDAPEVQSPLMYIFMMGLLIS